MSILRRRALPIAVATAISIVALACLLHGAPAHGQETPKQQNTLPEVHVEQGAKPPTKKKVVAKKSKPIQAPALPPTTSVQSHSKPPDPANALGTYNPALDLPNLELPPGTTIVFCRDIHESFSMAR